MRSKRRRQQVKKVWQIFRFEQRFELPDDVRFCRSGPLVYIRDYVGSGHDDEAIKYKQQIAACKAGPNRHKLLSVFCELREIAANHSRCYRGYLLNERFEPAGFDKIAVWVGLRKNETEKLMKELEQIGLIEQVPMPKFDLSINESPKDKGKKKGNKPRAASRRRRKPRASSRAHGESRAPLINKKQSGSGNGKSKRNSSGKPESDKGKKESKETTSTPTTTPRPTNPTGADARIHKSSCCKQSREAVTIGSILYQKLYDPQAEQFAKEVYNSIGTCYAKDSQQGRSELACWKSAWAKAQMSGIGPAYLAELWDRMIAEAMKLKLKRRRTKFTKSPEAVLRTLFDRILNSIKRRAESAGRQAVEVDKAKRAMGSQ